MKAGDLIRHIEDNVFGVVLEECAHPTWPDSPAIVVQWTDQSAFCTEFKHDESFEVVSSA